MVERIPAIPATAEEEKASRNEGTLKVPKPIVVLPTKTLPATVKRLEADRWSVVLCDRPDKVKLLLPTHEIKGSDLLMAAMHGIVNPGFAQPMTDFVRELYRRLKQAEESAKP